MKRPDIVWKTIAQATEGLAVTEETDPELTVEEREDCNLQIKRLRRQWASAGEAQAKLIDGGAR
ncbi:MAG TPA: hypothetical protein H9821_04790 [Candidatus Rothia avicola]|uniref:Uncharacterized protein n=1 Tax=Candidatus Rothia avicola TaxID=2840478 RepID=A0A9D2CQW5_9MICC|nr:hypothetical protein [Candidatus Rothia avicola]